MKSWIQTFIIVLAMYFFNMYMTTQVHYLRDDLKEIKAQIKHVYEDCVYVVVEEK